MTLLAATIRSAAGRYGTRPFLRMANGATLTFEELDRGSDEVAVGLAARGVAGGIVAVLALPSGPEYAVAYAALAKLGAITAGINPALAAAERSRLVEVARPALVVTTPELRPPDLGDGVDVIEVELAEPDTDPLRALRAPGGTPPVLPEDADRGVAVIFTSGTTGTPKGAYFTERQFAAALEAELTDPWPAGRHIISGTQFAHVGFMLRMHSYLEMGTTLCLMDRWRAEDALELVERHRMPAINGVSAQIALMLRALDRRPYDLSSVERIVTGGGPSTPELIDEATRRFGAPYTSRYSMTESGGLGTATALDADREERYHTVGRPRGGIALRIVDPDAPGREVPTGEVGEICLRGDTVMAGYWQDAAATDAVFVDGWLRTGDLGRIEADGLVRLAGRSKEMFIRGGYNVYPQEVEAALASHPAIASIVVVPRPDDVMGEVGVAVLVVRAGATAPTRDDLRAFGAERLARYKLPEHVVVVDELPTTAMQKIDRRALQRLVVAV